MNEQEAVIFGAFSAAMDTLVETTQKSPRDVALQALGGAMALKTLIDVMQPDWKSTKTSQQAEWLFNEAKRELSL